jgi:hypothetical protein
MMEANTGRTNEAQNEYDHTGQIKYNDKVVTSDGSSYHIPPTSERHENAPLHSRKIAFDAKETSDYLSDRVTRWKLIDPTPDLDSSGEVVYAHKRSLFIEVDGFEEDVKVNRSDISGNPEIGDTILIDWIGDGPRVLHAEVDET